MSSSPSDAARDGVRKASQSVAMTKRQDEAESITLKRQLIAGTLLGGPQPSGPLESVTTKRGALHASSPLGGALKSGVKPVVVPTAGGGGNTSTAPAQSPPPPSKSVMLGTSKGSVTGTGKKRSPVRKAKRSTAAATAGGGEGDGHGDADEEVGITEGYHPSTNDGGVVVANIDLSAVVGPIVNTTGPKSAATIKKSVARTELGAVLLAAQQKAMAESEDAAVDRSRAYVEAQQAAERERAVQELFQKQAAAERVSNAHAVEAEKLIQRLRNAFEVCNSLDVATYQKLQEPSLPDFIEQSRLRRLQFSAQRRAETFMSTLELEGAFDRESSANTSLLPQDEALADDNELLLLGVELGLLTPQGEYTNQYCGCEAKLEMMKEKIEETVTARCKGLFLGAFVRRLDAMIEYVQTFSRNGAEQETKLREELAVAQKSASGLAEEVATLSELTKNLQKTVKAAGIVTNRKGVAFDLEPAARMRHVVLSKAYAAYEKERLASHDRDGYVDPFRLRQEELNRRNANAALGRRVHCGTQTLSARQLFDEMGIVGAAAAGGVGGEDGGENRELADRVKKIALPDIRQLLTDVIGPDPSAAAAALLPIAIAGKPSSSSAATKPPLGQQSPAQASIGTARDARNKSISTSSSSPRLGSRTATPMGKGANAGKDSSANAGDSSNGSGGPASLLRKALHKLAGAAADGLAGLESNRSRTLRHLALGCPSDSVLEEEHQTQIDMSNAEAGALVAKTAKLIIEAAKELSAAVTSSSSSTAGGHMMSSSSLSTPAAGAGFGGPPAPPARVTFTPMADAPLTTPSGATAAESEEGRGKAKMSNAASSPRKGSRSNPSSPTSSSASASSPLGDGGGDSYSDSDDDDGGEEPMDNKASGGRRRRGLQQNDGEKEGNSSRRKRGASVASVASTTSVAKGGGQAARGFSTKGGTKKSDTSGSGPSSPKKRNASSTSVTLPAEGGGGGVGGSSSNKAAHKVASASNLKAEQQRLESLEGDLRRHKAAVEDYEASLCLLATSLGQLFAPTAERFDDCCGAFATRLIGPAGLRGGGGDKGNGSNAQLMRSRHASGTNLTLLAKQEGEEGDGGAPTVAFGAVTLPSQDVGGDCEDDTDTNNDSTSSSTASARPRKEPPPLAFRPDRDIGRASAGALAYASAIQNDLLDAAALGAVPSVLVDVATDTVMKVSALERACESLGLWAASDLPTAVALAKSESRALGAVRARHDERERAAEAVARAREVRLTAEADAAEKALAELEKSSGGSGSAKVGTFEEIAAATALLQKKKSDAAAAKKASSGSNSNSSDQSSAAKMGFTPTQKLEMGRGVNILIVMQCLHACARRVEKVSAAVSRRLPPKLEEATAMRAGSAQLFARFTDFVASSQQIMRSLLMPQQQQQKTLAFGGSSGNSNGSINSKLSQSQRSDGGGAVTLNPPPPPLLAGAVDYAALPTDLRQFLESSAISVSAVMSGVAASAASSTLSPPAPPAGSNNSSVTQLASALMTPPSASSLAPKTASAAETETPSSLNIQHQRAFLEACRLWISASRHMEKVLADAAKATAATADNAAKKKSFSRGGGGGEETATSGGGAAGGRRESTTSTISTQTPAANLAGTLGGRSSTANTGGTPPPNSILRKATLSNPSAVAVAIAAANKKTDDVGDVSPPFVPSGGGAALDADGLFILPFNLSNKMTQTALSAAHLSAAMAALSAQIAAGPPESRGGQEEKEEGPTESIEDRQKRRGERKSAVGEEEKEAMTQKKKNSTMSPAKGRSVAVTSKKSVVATTAANGNNSNNNKRAVGANRGSAKKSAGGDGGNDHQAPPDTNTDITYNNLGEGGHEDDDEDDTIELYESAGDDSDASNAFASAGPSSQQHSPQHYPIADTSAHTISASSAAAPIVGGSRRTSQRRSVVLIEEPIHYSDSGKPHNQQQHQGEGGKKKEEGEGKAPAPAASPEYESLLSSGLHTHSPVIVSSIVPTPTAAQAGGAFSYYGTGGSPAIGKEGEGPLLLGAAAMPSHAGASAGSAPPSHSPSLSVSASSAHHLLRHHNSAGTVVSQVSSLIPTDGPTYRRATAAEGSGEALFGPSVASMHTSPVRKRRGEGGDTLPPHKVGEVVAIEENGEPKQREEEEEGRRGSSTDATTTTNNTSASNTPSTSSVTPHVKVSYRRSGKSVASSHNASANRSFASSSTTNLNNAANASTSSMTTTTTKITVRANASYLAPTASSRTKQSGTNLSEVARGLANVKRRDAIDDEGRVLHNMVSSEDYDEAVRRLAAAAEERDAAVAEVAKLRATVHQQQQQQPTPKDAASINNAALMSSSSSSSAAAAAESPAAAALRLRVASLEEALKQQRAEMEKAALDADVAIKNANAAAAAAAASLLKAPAASRKRLATVVGRSGGGGGGAGSSSGEESSALHSSRSVEERLGGAGGGEQTLHVPPLQQAEGAPTNAPTNANANPQLQQQQLEGLPPASAFQRRRSFAASGINSNSGRGSNRGGRGGGGYHDEDLSLLQHLLHNPNPTAAAASGSNYGDAAAAEGTFGAFPMDPHDFDEEVNAEGGAGNDDDEDRVVVDDVMILHSRVHELASMGLDSDNPLVQRSAAMMGEYEASSNQQQQEQQEGGGAVAEAQRRLEGLELDLQMARIAAAAAEKKAASSSSSSSVGNAHSSQQQRASLSLSNPNLITSAATRAAGDFGSDATTATDSGASASPSLQQQQSHITALEARVAEAAGALRAAQQQGKQQQFPAAVPPRFGHSVMDVLVMSAELIMELLDHPATRAVFDEHKRRAAEGGVGGGGAGSTLPPFVLSGYQQQQQQRGARGGRVGDNPLGLHHHHHPNGHSALKATLEGSVLSNRAATSSTVAGAGGGTVDFIRSPREGSDSGGTSDGPLSMRTSTETLLPLMPNGSGKGGAATTSEAGGLLGRLHAILSPRSTLSTPAPSSSAGGVGSDTARRGLSSGSGFSADPLTATETAEGGGVAPDFGASPSRLAMKLRGEANSNAKKTAAAVGLRETIVIDLSTPPPSISADGAMMAATGAEGILLAANTDEVAPPPSTVHGRRGESRETITLRGSRLPPRHQRYDNDNDQGSDDGSDFTSGSSSTSESGHHSGKEEMGSGGRRRRYRSPERNAAAALRRQERRRAAAEARPHFLKEEEGGTPQQSPTLFLADAAAVATEKTKRPNNSDASVPLPPPDYELEQFKRLREKRRGHDEATRVAKAAAEEKQQAERNAAAAVLLRARGAQQAAQRGGANRPTHHGSPVRGSHAAALRQHHNANHSPIGSDANTSDHPRGEDGHNSGENTTSHSPRPYAAFADAEARRAANRSEASRLRAGFEALMVTPVPTAVGLRGAAAAAGGGGGRRGSPPLGPNLKPSEDTSQKKDECEGSDSPTNADDAAEQRRRLGIPPPTPEEELTRLRAFQLLSRHNAPLQPSTTAPTADGRPPIVPTSLLPAVAPNTAVSGTMRRLNAQHAKISVFSGGRDASAAVDPIGDPTTGNEISVAAGSVMASPRGTLVLPPLHAAGAGIGPSAMTIRGGRAGAAGGGEQAFVLRPAPIEPTPMAALPAMLTRAQRSRATKEREREKHAAVLHSSPSVHPTDGDADDSHQHSPNPLAAGTVAAPHADRRRLSPQPVQNFSATAPAALGNVAPQEEEGAEEGFASNNNNGGGPAHAPFFVYALHTSHEAVAQRRASPARGRLAHETFASDPDYYHQSNNPTPTTRGGGNNNNSVGRSNNTTTPNANAAKKSAPRRRSTSRVGNNDNNGKGRSTSVSASHTAATAPLPLSEGEGDSDFVRAQHRPSLQPSVAVGGLGLGIGGAPIPLLDVQPAQQPPTPSVALDPSRSAFAPKPSQIKGCNVYEHGQVPPTVSIGPDPVLLQSFLRGKPAPVNKGTLGGATKK